MATGKELPPITGWRELADVVLVAQVGFSARPPEDCEQCGGLLMVREDAHITETPALEAVIVCTRCRDRREVYVTREQAWEAWRFLQSTAPDVAAPDVATSAKKQLAFDLGV